MLKNGKVQISDFPHTKKFLLRQKEMHNEVYKNKLTLMPGGLK